MWKRYRPHRRGEQCSPGLTLLPCRASPLKRRQFEKASSYRGGGTKCRRSDTPTGESCSPGLTSLPCRASPLKRRRFEKASSYRGGGTKCRRSDAPPGEQCSPLQNHFTTPHHMKNRRFCSVGCRVSDAGKCAGFSRELPETEIFFGYRVNSCS